VKTDSLSLWNSACARLEMQYARISRWHSLSVQTPFFLSLSPSFSSSSYPYEAVIVSFYFLGGVQVSPFGTSATNWPIVPVSDDWWWWGWSSRWNKNWQGKPKYSNKTSHSTTLSTTYPTLSDLGSNPGRSGGKLATNRPSCCTAEAVITPRGPKFSNKTT
jgi:hypothetical protein